MPSRTAIVGTFNSMSVCLCILLGTVYSYPIWSPDLKSQFGFTQSQINLAASFFYVGVGAGSLLSPIVLHLVGFNLTIIFAGALDVSGYTLLYFAKKSESEAWHSVALLCLFLCMVGSGAAMFYSVNCGKDMEMLAAEHHPFIIGALAACYALGHFALLPMAVALYF
jgi:hypothetical protein